MIDQDLQEVLAELINIAFGTATATIAEIFDNFATLHVPDIRFIPMEELDDFILKDFNYHEVYTTTQQFRGKFQGETVFVIDRDSALNMQRVIFAEDISDEDMLDEDDLKQSILEISNILGSSCIGKLVELLSTNVTFAPPVIEITKQLTKDSTCSQYSHVIIISTVMEFEDIAIRGKLFIMFSDEMVEWLESALENYMENL